MVVKLLMVLGVAVAVGYIASRLLPRLRHALKSLGQSLARNPLLKTLLIGGVLRLLRLLVFRRF